MRLAGELSLSLWRKIREETLIRVEFNIPDAMPPQTHPFRARVHFRAIGQAQRPCGPIKILVY